MQSLTSSLSTIMWFIATVYNLQMKRLAIRPSSSDHPEVPCETHPEQGQGGRGGAGERQAGRKTPVTQEPCLSSQDANESEIEQSHYLGAQGLKSSDTGFRVQSQDLLHRSCEAVESMWPGIMTLGPSSLHAERKESCLGRIMFSRLDP